MRYKRTLALAALTLVSLAFASAHAATVYTNAGALNGLDDFSAALADGDSVTVDELVVAPGAWASEDGATPWLQSTGCIRITTALGTDRACGPFEPGAVSLVEQPLVAGVAVLRVEAPSSMYPGAFIRGVVVLGGTEPPLVPFPSAGLPEPGGLPSGQVTLSTGTGSYAVPLSGRMESSHVGGGSIEPLAGRGTLYLGVSGQIQHVA